MAAAKKRGRKAAAKKSGGRRTKAQRSASARKGARLAYFPELGGMTETPVYDRYQLGPGSAFVGPAIVEERESTLIVGPGGRCRVDAQWNLIVELQIAN